jgi:cytochrome c biogenesis factor
MGTVLLSLAMLAAIASAGVAAGVPRPDRPGRAPDPATLLLIGAVVLIWAAVATLAIALIREDTALAYVVQQTRAGTGWGRRATGLWSGAEGSLLVFVACIASALVVGFGAAPRWQRVGAASVAGGLVATSMLAADPFERLALPPPSGVGMAPILEHGAMFIHPPLLYAGFALALTPGLVRDRQRAHRLGLAAFAVLTSALAIGASWAYVELGWGGWWAWDPIENVGLVVWLLLAAALHTRALDPDRAIGTGLLNAAVLWSLCWPAVFGGAALTRTSLRTSVHAFADAAHLAVWLWPLVALTAVGAALRVAEDRPTIPERRHWPLRAPQAVLALAALVVAAGTYRPFIGGDGTAGWFYSRTLFPIAVAGVVLAVVLPARRRGQPPKRSVGEPGRAARLAPVVLGHGGMVAILFAAVAGTAATDASVRLLPGATAEVDGRTVILENITVDGEAVGGDTSVDTASPSAPSVVVAHVLVDGRRLEPSVSYYPQRQLRLPEIATDSRPWVDVQVVLRDVDPATGALLTVRVRPFNQLVWWGAGLVTLAGLGAAAGPVVWPRRPAGAGSRGRSRPGPALLGSQPRSPTPPLDDAR